MDNCKNNNTVNNNIFKYGPPVDVLTVSTNPRNALYKSNLSNSVQELVQSNVNVQVNSQVTEFINTNVTNIIEESDIINENITNIVNQNIDIPLDLDVNTLNLGTDSRGKISITNNTHIEGINIIANSNEFNNISTFINYGLVTNKPFYIDNGIFFKDKELKVVNDNLFFNGKRITDIDKDEIYNNISPFNIDDNDNTYTFSNVGINTGNANNYNLTVDGNSIVSDILYIANLNNVNELPTNNYGIVTNKPIYIDNSIVFKDKELKVRDDNLFFNGKKVTDIDKDEIYNNISAFNVDDNGNTYTFSKVGINTGNPNNFNLTVDGTTNITGDTTLNGDLYFGNDKIHVQDNELYFNNQLVSCCTYEGKRFYLCFDYPSANLTDLENEIKTQLTDLGITTTYINFTFTDVNKISVLMNLRDDICLNSNYQENTITQIENAYNLIVSGSINITLGGVTKPAVPDVYLFNKFYYFNNLSKNNSFKLVKRFDETNNKAIVDDNDVFLVNINDEYLQKNLSFAKSGSNNLLLKVHAYTNSFLSENKTCFINLTDGFKLEYLPGMMINDSCFSTNDDFSSGLPTNCFTKLVLGTNYDANTFTQDSLWTNIGINPDNITEEIFLSTNISDFIEDSSKYNDIYLIDQRWLTIVEIDGNVTYGQTYNNNHDDSKKFLNGFNFCNTNNIPDYVFHDSYNLETIEKHGENV